MRGRATSYSPRVAVVTMARDESEMLPRWVDHYGRHVGIEHLLVLDDNSTDGSTSGLACEVRPLPALPGGDEFERVRMKLINRAAADLLRTHDWVVFADADEFLVPDPARHGSLPQLLASHREQAVVGAVGVNVLHDHVMEAPLDPGKPVIGQRRLAQVVPLMCKPAAKQVRRPWVLASHGIRSHYHVDTALFMVHLKFADRDQLVKTSAHRRHLVARDGRASRSSWSRANLPALLDERVAAVRGLPLTDFDDQLATLDLGPQAAGKKRWRTPTGQSQVQALRQQRVTELPTRLRGLV